MGYSHYWKINLNRVSPEQFTALGLDAMRIIFVAKMLGINVVRESDRPDDPPEVRDGVIVFNGPGEAGHDTFWLDLSTNTEPLVPRPSEQDVIGHRGRLSAAWFEWSDYDQVLASHGWRHSFCKTAHKPYDALVCAILIRAKEILGPAIGVSSDGDFHDTTDGDGTWAEGRALYAAVFSTSPASPLDRDEFEGEKAFRARYT